MTDSFIDTVQQLEQQIQDIGYEDTHLEELPPLPGPGSDSKEDVKESPEVDQEDLPARCVIVVDAAAGPDFVLFAHETERYIEVQSTYALWRDIADAISEERAETLVPDGMLDDVPEGHPIRSVLPPHQIEGDDNIRIPMAALELLEETELDVRKEIVYQLSEIFTTAEVKHIVDSPSDTGAPHGFNVYYKIFPYESEFSIRELNEVIERVRMAAHRGTMFLRYVFNLGVDISRTTAGDVGDDPTTPTGDLDLDVLSDRELTESTD